MSTSKEVATYKKSESVVHCNVHNTLISILQTASHQTCWVSGGSLGSRSVSTTVDPNEHWSTASSIDRSFNAWGARRAACVALDGI